jgi:outer membrane protein assembly factor BamD (BamD/ComL family)
MDMISKPSLLGILFTPYMKNNNPSKNNAELSVLILCFLFSIIAQLECATNFEESESNKLYKKGVALEEKGEIIPAIIEYLEIVEFFPKTKVWARAAIKLSSLYLARKQVSDSAEVLKRLKHTIITNANDKLAIYCAQWDFFAKQKKIPELIIWLSKIPKAEKAKLTNSQEFMNRIQSLSKIPDSNVQVLLDVCYALNVEEPIAMIYEINVKNGVSLDKDGYIHLLKLTIGKNDLKLISQTCRSMKKNGWHKEIHQVFIKYEKLEESQKWTRVWLSTLIDGKMWRETEQLLMKVKKEDFIEEHFVVYLGLEKWREASQLLKENYKWVFSSLKYDDLYRLLKVQQKQSFTKSINNELIGLMPESDKKNMLKVELESDHLKKVPLLKGIVLSKSLFSQRASFSLAKIYFSNRSQKELNKLYSEFSVNYPSSEYIKDIEGFMETLNAMLSVKPNQNIEK